MTDNAKKFGELLSNDEGVRKELDEALAGLDKNGKEASTGAMIKVAAKHGLTLTAEDFVEEARELSEDELSAVAGGYCGDIHYTYCAMAFSSVHKDCAYD